MTKRSPYDFDGSVSLAAGLQRTRKKKRRESPSVGERKANEAWLASALHPMQQNDTLQAAVQLKAVDVRLHPYMHMAEKRAVQTQAHVPMSVQVLEQKKMLLPYLDKIEYINCQLRQRGLLPAEEKALVKDERSEVTTSSQLGRKPPTRSLPAALATRNQDEQDTDKNTTANTASVKVSTRMLQMRYPRFFEMAQANKQQTVLPRQRGINWLLRMIEVVYNALADILLLKTGSDRSETELSSSDMWVKPNSGSQSRLATPGWLAMPFFTRRFIHHSLGLPELADQECLDLMYNIELTRELYPQVSLFASFLREIYDEDTLLFFLFVRSQLQDEFDLDLAAKEKQAHSSRASGSKKYITANMIELRNHPLIPDGTKQVFLSSAACEGVLLRVFESARRLRYAQASKLAAPIALARYIVREPIVSRLQADTCHFTVSAEVFLTTLVKMFEEVAEDILAQFKFNDDGESLSNLIRLRDTITLDSKVEKFVALYAEQERALRNQKIELMKMERSNTEHQFRVQIRLLQNQIRLQEQELQHVQKKIVDGENQVNNVWNDVIAAKASSNKATVQRTSGDSLSSKALISVLGRFEAQIGRLEKKHDIAVKASMLLAVPWQQQMDELRLRMVIRIQRAYRARKRPQETKRRARDKLSAQIREREIKMKNQELERKRLDALREKGMERHQQRLKARKEQEDKQKRDLEEKQKKVVKRAREEEATQRAVAMKKKELVHVMTRWNLFVIRKKNRRKAHLLFLKFKLMKWKLHLTQHKQMTRAARTIQRFIHRRQEQKQLRKLINVRVKRTKMAKRYLLKVQSRMTNRLFNHWAAFTIEQQKLRENFAAIIQRREGHWFQWWVGFVDMMKTRKLEAAILIQRQYRGRVARQVFKYQRDRHRKAVAIKRVYRGYRGRVIARRRRQIKATQDKGVEVILRRVRYREAGLCFDMIVRYTYWERRIKEMTHARKIALERAVRLAWSEFVTLKKEKRAERLRLRNHSASIIQRNFRRHLCQVVFKETLRNHRAAVTIQRVFRGFLGRNAAHRRRWEMYAATQIQTVWRRHKATKYVAALRTEKILLVTYKGDYTTVKRAIDNGFWYVTDNEGNSILHVAAAAGHKRLVKLCLRNSFDINGVNTHSQTALHLLLANLPLSSAVFDVSDVKGRDERVALAEYMIEHGAWHEAPDEEGFTPLLLCASLGQSEAVDMLLNHGANTEARTSGSNLNAPQLAVEGNFSTTLKVLLESGNFDTGDTGNTTEFLLHACAGRGLIDCVRVLVDHIRQRREVFGYDALNLCDSEGYTPLIYAVSNGYLDATECLLEADAGPDVKDYFGRSPLHFALITDDSAAREALVNLLIQYDAEVNVKDTDGDAPLHVSCVDDARLACTHLLLTNGALICANALGNHPTHIAARNGAVDTLKLLIDYGGDMNLKNYDGKTPLGMARMNDQVAVVDFVAAYFAQESALKKSVDTPELPVEDDDNNQENHERSDNRSDGLQDDKFDNVEDENLHKSRTLSEWVAAVSEAYCMGSLAEWTQYIDAETEVPFYYSMGPSGEHVYTWDTPVEFDAALGEIWEIVRGPSTVAALDEEQDPSSTDSRYYLDHNRMTDELTSTIPPINYALLQDVVQNSKRMRLLRARVRKVSTDELSASAMEYMRFFRGFEEDSAQMRKEMRAAIKIQRHFRARRTHLLIKALLHQNRCAVDLQRAFRGRKARREGKLKRKQQLEVVKIQALYRGHLTRKREERGLRSQRQLHLKRRLAAREIQRFFRGCKGRKVGYREKVIQNLGPKSYFEWEALRKRAQVTRSYKVWDEMEARTDFPGVLFYCHRVTRACGWQQPPPWVEHDREAFENRLQLVRWGYTETMQHAAQTLQRLWRARIARISFQLVLRAVRLMRTCEQEYLEDPTHLAKMGNYVLYLHTITHDYERARPLYGRLLRVMAQRGPDIPFILFSYGIFLYITQEEDTTVVEEMILRGNIADPTLVKYKVAFLGFFRQAILQNPDDAEAHINYAACVQWLYEQYDEATTHYLKALALAPQRKGTLELFQNMLNNKRRIERSKLTPRSKKALKKKEDAGEEEQFDAFAQFRRWQAKQAEQEDLSRRMVLQAEQDLAARQAAARKIQARYRRQNAMRKVTRLRLEYKLAAIKAEETQQQALYDRITEAFEDILSSSTKKKRQGDPGPVLNLPVGQLDAVFISLKMEFTEAQLNAVSAKFRKDHPKVKHVNVMDMCRFIQAHPLLQERLPTIFPSTVSNTS
ncbi:IQ calmodulin binding motif-containing protein [Phytophthora infestans]|uniref:IQ calmodulin binding motif-containing protein n=1 Tax=Phytophthora infestans TaxID=4787 RepID=A0A833T8Z3_PHYIN|nr:IQ calmodulin binding motif-containing protein [Phytophthora infestans]